MAYILCMYIYISYYIISYAFWENREATCQKLCFSNRPGQPTGSDETGLLRLLGTLTPGDSIEVGCGQLGVPEGSKTSNGSRYALPNSSGSHYAWTSWTSHLGLGNSRNVMGISPFQGSIPSTSHVKLPVGEHARMPDLFPTYPHMS